MITSASPQSWITGAEFAAERNRLRKMGLVPHSSEYEALVRRVDERNDYIWESYAAPLLEQHPGNWAAIATTGQFLVGETSWAVEDEADRKFGPGDYYLVKLTPDRGAVRIGPRR